MPTRILSAVLCEGLGVSIRLSSTPGGVRFTTVVLGSPLEKQSSRGSQDFCRGEIDPPAEPRPLTRGRTQAGGGAVGAHGEVVVSLTGRSLTEELQEGDHEEVSGEGKPRPQLS